MRWVRGEEGERWGRERRGGREMGRKRVGRQRERQMLLIFIGKAKKYTMLCKSEPLR